MKVKLLGIAAILALTACGTNSQFDKGWQAYQAGDFETARTAFEPLANEGNPMAANNLGMLYRDGKGGLAQDYGTALKYFEIGAAGDFSFSYNNIALMAENGWGMPQNPAKAFEFYTKAYNTAKRDGNYYAPHNLGRMYEYAFGVEKDMDRAIELYKESSDMGYEPATKDLKRLGINY